MTDYPVNIRIDAATHCKRAPRLPGAIPGRRAMRSGAALCIQVDNAVQHVAGSINFLG